MNAWPRDWTVWFNLVLHLEAGIYMLVWAEPSIGQKICAGGWLFVAGGWATLLLQGYLRVLERQKGPRSAP